MVLLRLIGLFAVVAVAVSALLYAFTGQRRYLSVALNILRFAIGAALLFFALLALERLAALV